MSSFNPVIAVQRAFEVLAVVNRHKNVSIQTIHQETGLHKATIIRMLDTLIHEGYVAKAARSVYVPTARTLLLSQGYDRANRVGEIAGPILAEFRRKIGWPSDISIYSDNSMLVVQTTREQGPLYFNRKAGYRAPILVTSIGQAYLAFCSAKERRRIILDLAKVGGPRNERAKDSARLENDLAKIREQGFATMRATYSNEEYGGKIWGMAVPVRDDGGVYGAVNILMLKSASSEDAALRRFLRPLQEVGLELGRAIGAEIAGAPLDESIAEGGKTILQQVQMR
jgi:IclR family transcriptional regulator, mhp operon transcriptional activator